MLTEQDRLTLEVNDLKNGIRLCEEALSKSEKYELLKDNPQWQGYLEDLAMVAKVHESEIRMGTMMMVDAPHTGYVTVTKSGEQRFISSKDDWMDFVVRHQIQKQEAENWMKEPERILSLASQARKKLPELKARLAKVTEGGNHAESVGL